MNTRNTVRLDYEKLHKYGLRVPKATGFASMEDNKALNELKIDEKKIRSDINHHLEIYTVDELDSVEEIEEAIGFISDDSQRFRYIHLELETLLAGQYEGEYPEYRNVNKELIDFTREARRKMKRLKEDNVYKDAQRKKLDFIHFSREKVRADAELLVVKHNHLNDLILIFPLPMDLVIEYISKMEELLSKMYDTDRKARYAYDGDEYKDLFQEDFRKNENNLNQDLKMAKLLRVKASEYFDQLVITKSDDQVSLSHVMNAESIFCEITMRCEVLEEKYSIDLNHLSDYQLLDINNKNLDKEFNGILQKITSLASFVPSGGGTVQRLFQTATENRDSLVSKRKRFQTDLSRLVVERDVTPDKLRNASMLEIEIPKFTGYDAKMDIFTFKTEFKKLVEPVVKKSCWADYLKRNYLGGSALTLVEREVDYSQIWEKLFASYGNARVLLQSKFGELEQIGGLWKIKNDEKLILAIAELLNTMKEMGRLAREHKIEGQLYEGGGLEKVMSLLGEGRHRRFREKYSDPMEKEAEWEKLVDFLQKEFKVRERLAFDNKNAIMLGMRQPKVNPSDKSEKSKAKGGSGSYTVNDGLKCHICEKVGHVVITTAKGKKILPYYVCETFVQMTPESRHSTLDEKNLCTGCMFPGAVKGANHRCFMTKFCCPHTSHSEKVHILLCSEHKTYADSKKVFERFKTKFIDQCKVQLPAHTKNLTFFSQMVGVTKIENVPTPFGFECEPPITDASVFLLQSIELDGVKINLFFDNGCGECVIKKSLVDKLAAIGRAKEVVPGPLFVRGVGDIQVRVECIVTICIPLRNGLNAQITGSCMTKITAEFPMYTLDEVEKDIRDNCLSQGSQELVDRLPRLPHSVGGETDILLGSKFAKYQPREIFRMDSGLTLFESFFLSQDGSSGVVGGPHPKFSEIEQAQGHHVDAASYFETPVLLLRCVSSLIESTPLLGAEMTPDMSQIDGPLCCSVCGKSGWPSTMPTDFEDSAVNVAKRPPKCIKKFDEIEEAGTEVTYRCVECRSCVKCKNGMRFDSISIQEEVEQAIIERSVHVDPVENVTKAKLPFLVNPDTRLTSNENDALKVFKRQVQILNQKPEDKKAVIEFEKKLQDMGFVEYVSSLDDVIKMDIMKNAVKYFIPWRAVYNQKSLSTPCRMVFDASMGSKNACSLNSLLAKGTNSLNNLIEILIRFQTHKCAFHTDVTKMYNRISLDQAYWRYQLYLWVDGLVEGKEPVWKVIKTLIYGVRSSGNLAECGLRRTAELSMTEFPRAYEIIKSDTYMDDCLSGEDSLDRAKIVTDNLVVSMARGGFSFKGFTFAGEAPPKHLTEDGESVLVAGLKWYSEGDFIKLNIQELNFNKKFRGRKAEFKGTLESKILTKLDCVKVVAEIFDPTGKVAPITGGMKLDISLLHERGLSWDDPLPAELKNIWAANFDLIQELGTLKFKRAVVPEDACSLDIETIDAADAGENLICAAIYARFKLRGGGYSCQLIFARTKVVHDITVPRAELVAALLNASTGHIVKLSLKELLVRRWKLTDSQVALHWINSTKTKLKQFIRNRSIEITRLTNREDWWYVPSKENVADIGTRKGAQAADVDSGSIWAVGYPWMSEDEERFPLKSAKDIILSEQEKTNFEKECVVNDILATFDSQCFVKYVPNDLGDRYKFSKYLVDPNKYRFRTVLRILSVVLLFIKKCSRNMNRNFLCFKTPKFSSYSVSDSIGVKHDSKTEVVHVPDEMLMSAKMYYFRKCTLEIQKFVDPNKYKNNSVLHEGVLYHTGRILSTEDTHGKLSLSDACLDLTSSTFCVPIVDSLSPVAYAIVSETHWHHPDVNHGGVESVLRFSQMTAYILGGRELVKTMKKACARCRILHKKRVEVAMGPLSEKNLCIAPPFYFCQVDICGPLSAYSPANKRATLKVWFVVLCCTTTGVVDCRVMEDYTADAFVQAFERFSCRFGYPKMVLPDEGSQLVRGCEGMVLSFIDISLKLSREYGVQFKTCPVGAHNVHGKVERKIKEVRKSIRKSVSNKRLSILQWETLGQQISNSINNLPICIGNKTELIENLDILTPNRLILGRNNNRCPTEPLKLEQDLRGIVEGNGKIFEVWFKEWLTSVVPLLVERPKWFVTDRHVSVGDIVLFLKSDKEFNRQYQYGVISSTIEGKDGLIRTAVVEYHNHNEKIKRTTRRSVRDLVVIHPINELGIMKELHDFASSI